MKPKEILTKEILYQEYVIEKKSIYQIRKKYKIKSHNSVTQLIKKYGLTRESLRVTPKELTKEYFELHYFQEGKTLKEIGKIFNRSRSAIKRIMLTLGLKPKGFYMSEKRKQVHKNQRTGYEEINGRFWYSIQGQAQIRDLELSITPKQAWELFLKQNRKCALSNLHIRFSQPGEKSSYQTASLDRIDSSKGYTVDNIQWVHKDINRMKQAYSQEYFIEMCKKVAVNN